MTPAGYCSNEALFQNSPAGYFCNEALLQNGPAGYFCNEVLLQNSPADYFCNEALLQNGPAGYCSKEALLLNSPACYYSAVTWIVPLVTAVMRSCSRITFGSLNEDSVCNQSTKLLYLSMEHFWWLVFTRAFYGRIKTEFTNPFSNKIIVCPALMRHCDSFTN